MKCIQVLPILKHTFSEELTYWTTHDFQIGDLIQVELNHRKIYAVVSSIVSLSEAKEFIKSRDFKIKKIETYVKVDFFSNAFIRACLQTSKYYLRPFGEILSEYIPKNVLAEIGDREVITKSQKIEAGLDQKVKETLYIQKVFTVQISDIKNLAETHKKICVVVPTDSFKKHIQLALVGIENITYITPIDLYLLDESTDGKSLDLCILAYAGSEYYRHLRKHFDTRYMVREYCSIRSLQLVEIDSILPVYKNVAIDTFKTSKTPKSPEVHIVDQTISKTAKVQKQSPHSSKKILKKIARPEDEADVRDFMEAEVDIVTHKKLKLISPELYSLIVHAQKEKEDIFIYTTRKGLSSSVTCSDCGHILSCSICKKPFALKTIDGVLEYVCLEGHAGISIDSTCPVCGGMHLLGLGAGTEALVTELEHVISMPIVTVDGDTATQAGARNIFKKRNDKDHKPTIYIGTELALNQSLDQYFKFGAIASLETLLALPSVTAELEAARVIEAMREKTTEHLVIQARTPAHSIWKCIAEKTWNTLLMQVQNDTQDLSLPPYTTHIQLYISNQHKKATADIETIQSYLKGYSKLKPIYLHDEVRHIIHLYMPEWPTSRIYGGLHAYLKSLPKYIRVEVDSPSLL